MFDYLGQASPVCYFIYIESIVFVADPHSRCTDSFIIYAIGSYVDYTDSDYSERLCDAVNEFQAINRWIFTISH